MIAYFIDNYFKPRGSVATDSKDACTVSDTIRQNVDGVSTCDITIEYTGRADDYGRLGEYLFIPPNTRREASLFQIISRDVDYVRREIIYHGDTNFLWFSSQNTEDGPFGRESTVGQNIAWYLEEFTTSAAPFHYEIGINEISGKLATGNTEGNTAKEALNKTAELFDVEIAFSFTFDGKNIKAYLDIYERFNAHTTGKVLTVGEDLTELNETTDCSNIATAVRIRGNVSSSHSYNNSSDMIADENLEVGSVVITTNGNTPWRVHEMQTVTQTAQMTDPSIVYKISGTGYYLNGKSVTGWETANGFAVNISSTSRIGEGNNVVTDLPAYDEGDYYTGDGRLYSRSAWLRFGAPESGLRRLGRFSCDIILQESDVDTTDANQVLARAISVLEPHIEPTITYTCKCESPVELGAYYTLVVPDEKVYISARCLEIERSSTRNETIPTFGNFYKSTNAFEVMARNVK